MTTQSVLDVVLSPDAVDPVVTPRELEVVLSHVSEIEVVLSGGGGAGPKGDPGPPGTTDHGLLIGLTDPDHPISAVQGLQAALDGKAAAGTMTAHVAAADPHTGYQRETQRGAVNGYASLDTAAKVPMAELPTGITSSTVATGDHTHLDATRFYKYVQAVPSSVWTINHPLGYQPSVTVVNSTHTRVFGDLDYPTASQVVVRFAGAFSGEAYLS